MAFTIAHEGELWPLFQMGKLRLQKVKSMPGVTQLGSGWSEIRTGSICVHSASSGGTLLSWWAVRGGSIAWKRVASVLNKIKSSSTSLSFWLFLSLPLSSSTYVSPPPPSLPFLLSPSLSFSPLLSSLLHSLCLPAFPLWTTAPRTTGPTGCSSSLPRCPLQPLTLGPRLTVLGCTAQSSPCRALGYTPQKRLLPFGAVPLLSALSRGSDILAGLPVPSRLRVVLSPLSDVRPRCLESLPPNKASAGRPGGKGPACAKGPRLCRRGWEERKWELALRRHRRQEIGVPWRCMGKKPRVQRGAPPRGLDPEPLLNVSGERRLCPPPGTGLLRLVLSSHPKWRQNCGRRKTTEEKGTAPLKRADREGGGGPTCGVCSLPSTGQG